MAVVLTAASANAGVIVAENFGGNGSGGLAGTAADTFSPGITAAGGSATWVANSGFKDNGLVNNVSRRAAYFNMGSYINGAKGTAKGLFKLTMTISETTGTWISLGFGQENTPSTDKDFTNSSSDSPAPAQTTTGLGTIIYRSQTSPTGGELDMYGGGGSANAVDGPDFKTGNRTLTVTLDLTPAGGTHGRVTWSDSQLGVLGSYTYTAAKNFGSILISGTATGTISNLTLSQEGQSGPAHAPDPEVYETRVEIDLSSRTVPGAVSWLSPDNPDDPDIVQVFGYNVYMDTNQTRVSNATPASADLRYKSLQSGGQTGTSFDPGANLDYNTTYYWRVDAVVDLASVPGTTIAEATTLAGSVWSFTTMSPVDSPMPNHGESNAALSAVMSWQTPVAANLTYDVYFGTNFNAVAQAGHADYADLSLLAQQWLQVGNLSADRNHDNKVDFADFAVLANVWGASPEFKGNQTNTTFNPGGLAEATQYYWRVDAIDGYTNVYPGDVWTFSTYDTRVIRQQLVDCYDHDGVPRILASQKLPGYDPVNDPNNILAGQFDNTFNIRRQEVIYSLAFVYREPRSDYYRNSNILYRVLLNLDYICRAQAKNGGFNEKIEQGGWCGVALPDGGNNSRANEGSCTVTGFPMWLVGRSINMLQNEPAFVSALEEYIDNDGNGSKDVKRRDAYKYLFNNNINGGTMTGVIECMMIGKCAGGWPNQDCGALAAVQACNEAYKFLNNGTPYLSQTELNNYRDRVLFDNATPWPLIRYLDPTRRNWWTEKFMILENGHGALGYDTGYGNVPFGSLGSYAKHANDSVVAGFIGHYMNGYQYFYVMDDAWPDGGYWEWRTSRRQGKNTMNVFGFGISQPYHPAFAMMFDKTLSKLAKNPAVFLSWYWPSGLEPASMGELILTWNDPQPSNYVLPCNRPETFTYTDSEANLQVTKTGVSPTTVTWTAFNWDGGTTNYTYQAP